jgi:LysM repeat protein
MNAAEYDLTDLREMRYSGGRLIFNEGSKVKTVDSYSIKKGDTLSSIAKKFNTTVENLMEVNEIGNMNDISVDDTLNISAPVIKNKAINALKNIKDKRINDKAITAVKNLKSKRSKVDWDFISEQEDALRTLEAVVPMPKKSESGVTVSTGYDLGARKVEDLKRLPKSLQEKLIPYLGLKKEKAVEFLKLNPLKLTDEEYDIIKETIHKEVESKLRKMWEEDTGTLFSSLPKGKATILASITTQYGNMKTKTPNAWKQATSGDWKAFVENLKDFKDNFGPRRIRELEFWINSDTQDYLNSIGEEDLAARQSLIKDSEDRSKFAYGSLSTKASKGFFSAVEEAAEQLKTKKGSGQTFYNELKKKPFVTEDELKYSEIMDQLFMKPNLTKDEVKQIVSKSTPKIIFKDSKNDFEPEYEEWTILRQKTNPDNSANDQFINNLRLKETEAIKAEFPDGPPTLNQFIKKITDDDFNPVEEIDKYDDPRYNDAFFGSSENRDKKALETEMLLDSLMNSLPFKNTNYREVVAQFPDVGKFKNMKSLSEHHLSVPNHDKNFMHIRLSEGYDENKVSYSIIEEMQSDYHTEGRLSGYVKHDEDVKEYYAPSKGEIISLQKKLDDIINKNKELGNDFDLDSVGLEDMKFNNVMFDNNNDPELSEFVKNLVYFKAIPEESSFNMGIGMLSRLDLDPEIIDNLLIERAKAVKDFIKDRPRFKENITALDIDAMLSNYLFARVKEIVPRTVKNYYNLNDEAKDSILNILSDFDQESISSVYGSMIEPPTKRVKEAPFKDTWHKLAINKSVIDAVDKGDDGVALTLGKTHTERYGEDFGEKFDVLYDQKGKSYLKKLAKKYGLTVETKPLKIRSDNEMFEDIDETFYVLKFNDKLKKDVAENGLPQFAEGGLVNAD